MLPRRQVYSRLLSEPPGFLAPNSSVGRAAPDVHVEDKNDFLVRKCREVRKHGHCDCFGDAHGWMLSLAMRVCRRRLLNKSGWRGGKSNVVQYTAWQEQWSLQNFSNNRYKRLSKTFFSSRPRYNAICAF